MTTVSVWRFPTAFEADQGELAVKRLLERDAISVEDAMVVLWPEGASSPRTHRLRHESVAGGAGGAALGIALGALVAVPVIGLAVGVAAGTIRGRRRHAGIDKDVVDRVRAELGPGTSAMLLLADDSAAELLRPDLANHGAELLYSARLSERDGKPIEG